MIRLIHVLFLIAILSSCKDENPVIPIDTEPDKKSSVRLELDNILQSEGQILAAMYNDATDWELDVSSDNPSLQVSTFIIDAEQGSIDLVFDSLDAGTYAISLFHDINSNGILDKDNVLNTFPKEPYAFSIAEGPFFGAPDFIDCSFILEEDETLELNAELIHP